MPAIASGLPESPIGFGFGFGIGSCTCTWWHGLLIGLLGSSASFAPLVADTSLWFVMSGQVFDLTGSCEAAFVNGVAWNVLSAAIAYWLLRRTLRTPMARGLP